MKSKYLILLTSIICLFLYSCSDKKGIIDVNTEVPNRNWTYVNKFGYEAKIENENLSYNLFMNLRVTADYKYSNLFVLITQIGPDKKPLIKRYELTLANKEGVWLGEGSGNLYNYQLRYLHNYKFPKKGVYRFYIEQNMRDNPLREVSDVGMRVEKAQ